MKTLTLAVCEKCEKVIDGDGFEVRHGVHSIVDGRPNKETALANLKAGEGAYHKQCLAASLGLKLEPQRTKRSSAPNYPSEITPENTTPR